MKPSANLIPLLLLLCAGSVFAEQPKEDVRVKARMFYACHDFFEAVVLPKDSPFRGREKELSDLYGFKAASILVDVVDSSTAKSLAEDGSADHRAFMANVREIKDGTQRESSLKEFAASCAKAGDISNAPQAKSVLTEAERFAELRKIYGCFTFFLKMSQVPGGQQEEKDKFHKLSNQFLLKASQAVAAADGDKQNGAELAKRAAVAGEADLKSFMDNFLSLPTKEERRTKFYGYAATCTSMDGITQ